MGLHVNLTAAEARVIGCLMEKEIATPDIYPLSLNALLNACNQKSNRDPVVDWSEGDVLSAVNGLIEKHQVSEQTGYGSRVVKYEHRFCNTAYGQLQLLPDELAVVCELLLRGPQTPGELRGRASRLHPFGDAAEVDQVLHRLSERSLVAILPLEPGRRERRYRECFTEADTEQELTGSEPVDTGASQEPAGARSPDSDRIAALESRVAALEVALAALQQGLPPAG